MSLPDIEKKITRARIDQIKCSNVGEVSRANAYAQRIDNWLDELIEKGYGRENVRSNP